MAMPYVSALSLLPPPPPPRSQLPAAFFCSPSAGHGAIQRIGLSCASPWSLRGWVKHERSGILSRFDQRFTGCHPSPQLYCTVFKSGQRLSSVRVRCTSAWAGFRGWLCRIIGGLLDRLLASFAAQRGGIVCSERGGRVDEPNMLKICRRQPGLQAAAKSDDGEEEEASLSMRVEKKCDTVTADSDARASQKRNQSPIRPLHKRVRVCR
ncbi:hypothetical protein B0H19DRAFT_1161118 [Mycena capillaripes]|nr:hypothetical protein B0H19DRAFT_1161118 [Mycena capillaripes]